MPTCYLLYRLYISEKRIEREKEKEKEKAPLLVMTQPA
jgi:hypothetical protein